MVAFVQLNAFLKHIARQSDLFNYKLYRKKRVDVHCRVFIRMLKNKTRKKLMFSSKMKLSLRLAAMLTARLVLDRSEKQSRMILCNILDGMLMHQLMDDLEDHSLFYLQHVVRLQKYVRKRSIARNESLEQMQIRISVEHNIDRYEEVLKSKPKQRAIRKKYLKTCLSKFKEQRKEEGRTAPPVLAFFGQRQLLAEIILKLVEPKSPTK